MPKISSLAKCSQKYTNHCLRVTSCTLLAEKFSENDIKSVSGHKSNDALGIYRRVSEKRKSEMSDFLTERLIPTCSSHLKNEKNVKNNEIDFDMVDLDSDFLNELLTEDDVNKAFQISESCNPLSSNTANTHVSNTALPNSAVIQNAGTVNIYNNYYNYYN